MAADGKLTLALDSTLTCPHCAEKRTYRMPEGIQVMRMTCQLCHEKIEVSQKDCCVFCRYGTVPCPQQQKKPHF